MVTINTSLVFPQACRINCFKMLQRRFLNVTSTKKQQPKVRWQQAVEDLDPKQVESYHSEQLIKVDEKDIALGPISKGESHSIETVKKGIYHRALSLLLFDEQDRFLLTQRATSKITFPSYFTNACCSHPHFNQSEMEDDGNAIGVKRAAIRRSNFELGIKPDDIKLHELKFMNRLAYRAESDGGQWGESEIDYIFILRKSLKLSPNSEEVQDIRYVTKEQMHDLLSNAGKYKIQVTPWIRLLAQDFLFRYWDNLDDLSAIAQPESIISFKDLIPADRFQSRNNL